MEEGLIMNAWTEAFALPVVVGCLVLSWAGLEKLRDRAPLVAVVAEMGVPRRFALVTTVALLVAELGTVSAVLAGLPSYLALFQGPGYAARRADDSCLQMRTGAWENG